LETEQGYPFGTSWTLYFSVAIQASAITLIPLTTNRKKPSSAAGIMQMCAHEWTCSRTTGFLTYNREWNLCRTSFAIRKSSWGMRTIRGRVKKIHLKDESDLSK